MLRQIRQLSVVAGLLLVGCTKDTATPPTPSVAPAAKPVPYSVAVNAPGAHVTASPSTAVFTVSAADGYHVNPDYPVAFKPDPSPGLSFEGERIKLEGANRRHCPGHDDEDCAVDFTLPFTPTAEGQATVKGTLAFSVCSPETCLIEKVPVAHTLLVQAR